MIEQIMFFLLGAFVSALVMIALLPTIWRRAVRLTRARLAATLPLTPEEIAAGKDQLRAAHVVELHRREAALAQADSSLQAAKAEIGAKIIEIQSARAVIAARSQTITELQTDLADKRTVISGHEATITGLTQERDNLVTNLTASRIAHQAADQDASNARTLADQHMARIGELEGQRDTLNARLTDSMSVATGLREDIARRTQDLRETARSLRDATNTISITQRKLAAAESLAEERQQAIDSLNAERLRLIEEAGHLMRERDQERVERGAMAVQIDQLTRRSTEFEQALATSRADTNVVIRDLTRTVENLRNERRKADENIASLRLEKTQIESELLRQRRSMEQPASDLPKPALRKAGRQQKAPTTPLPAPVDEPR